MTRAGAYLSGRMRQNVGQGQPYKRYVGQSGVYYKGLQPGAPGSFPHKITGQLQRSITWTLDKHGPTLTVGSALNYAGFLETAKMLARPWLSLTWNAEREKVRDLILRG